MKRAIWLLAFTLMACPPPVDLGDGGVDNTIIVGPSGGLFIRNGYGIEVPAGAFTDEQRIFVTVFDTGIPEVPDRKRVSFGYRLSPSSLVPKSPLTLYLPWIADRVPPAVDSSSFDMRRQSGGDAYAPVSGAQAITTPFEAVQAKTEKLGVFWVTSPGQADIARVELDPKEAIMRVGDTKQFTAKVISPTGETLDDVPVRFSVTPPRVAQVTPEGLLTAKDPGQATLTASAGEQSVTAKIYVQGNTEGPTTFGSQNPFPTGNDLLGGSFAPGSLGTVYAGTNGTVLVEDNLGAWTRVFSTPLLELKAVAGTSLDNAVAIGQVTGAGVLIEFKGATTPASARTFQPTQISDLTALWFDGTSGMGVGTGNEVIIYREGQWTTEYHPSFEALLSVLGDGAGAFVVVGDLGSIYRWDPTRRVWDSLYDTRLSVKLEAAQLVGTSGEAWAVGGGRLWHFLGDSWVAEGLPTSPALANVTSLGLFDSRIFVGGEMKLATGQPAPPSKGVVLIRSQSVDADGGVSPPSWTSTLLRGIQIPRRIFGQSPSGTLGRVVGDLGAVWAWDSANATLVERSRGFQGDVADLAATETDLFAAVNECDDVRCETRHGVVMHRGASGFEALGAMPTTNPLFALVARSDAEVITSTKAGLHRWDGTQWVEVSIDGSAGTITDLAWCGQVLRGVDAQGNGYQGDATHMSRNEKISEGDLKAIHCPTADEVWVTGTQFLASKKGTGAWAQRTSTFMQPAWFTVWSPGPDEAFTFGDARFGAYWDTSTLLAQESTGPLNIDVATAMWGTKIDSLYMTGLTTLPGPVGFLLRYNGISWSWIDSGAHRKGTALTGRSATEVWLGTQGGGVLKAVAP